MARVQRHAGGSVASPRGVPRNKQVTIDLLLKKLYDIYDSLEAVNGRSRLAACVKRAVVRCKTDAVPVEVVRELFR